MRAGAAGPDSHNEMRLIPEFVSLGVNRVVGALDWGEHGLVAYGGHRVVAIYDPEVCARGAKGGAPARKRL